MNRHFSGKKSDFLTEQCLRYTVYSLSSDFNTLLFKLKNALINRELTQKNNVYISYKMEKDIIYYIVCLCVSVCVHSTLLCIYSCSWLTDKYTSKISMCINKYF